MDIIGKAASNYFYNKDPESIHLFIDGCEDGEMPPSVFFRTFNKLKSIEKKAIELCKGKTLDVGGCAGNYALELQRRGIDVTSLDISDILCKIQSDRGVKKVVAGDILDFTSEKYETILLMMNGFGIARELKRLPDFLRHLKKLLLPGGQILGDSTDIHYFEEEKIARGQTTRKKTFVGDVQFKLTYKGESEEFLWVYVDPETLSKCAIEAGLVPEIVKKGKDFSFLLRLVNA